MALLRMAEAARAAGVGRATLYRAVARGLVSVQDTPDGKRLDTSELLRWRGRLETPGTSAETSQPVSSGHPETSQPVRADTAELVAMLKAENERLRADLEAERQERRQAEREHREERQRLQEQIGRALLLLPAPSSAPATYVPLTEAGEQEVRRHLEAGRKARRRTRKAPKRRTQSAASERTRTTARPPERPQAPAAPTTLAGRVLEAVNVLVGATPPLGGRR